MPFSTTPAPAPTRRCSLASAASQSWTGGSSSSSPPTPPSIAASVLPRPVCTATAGAPWEAPRVVLQRQAACRWWSTAAHGAHYATGSSSVLVVLYCCSLPGSSPPGSTGPPSGSANDGDPVNPFEDSPPPPAGGSSAPLLPPPVAVPSPPSALNIPPPRANPSPPRPPFPSPSPPPPSPRPSPPPPSPSPSPPPPSPRPSPPPSPRPPTPPPALPRAPDSAQLSPLWGENGELYNPRSMMSDWSQAGYAGRGLFNTESCGFCFWANFLACNQVGARCHEAVLPVSVPPVKCAAHGWRGLPGCFLSLGCPECGLGPQCCAESPADQSALPGPVPAHPPGASPAPAPPPAANLQDIPTYPAKYNVKDFGARGDGNTGGSRLGDHPSVPVLGHALA